MKEKPKAQALYGPEVPGYAHLNEAIRKAGIPILPAKSRPRAKAKSQANEKTP